MIIVLGLSSRQWHLLAQTNSSDKAPWNNESFQLCFVCYIHDEDEIFFSPKAEHTMNRFHFVMQQVCGLARASLGGLVLL